MQTVSLSLFRFPGFGARLWVLGQMALARLPGVRPQAAEFWKLCGSGTGEGFTPRPNFQIWVILAVWPDLKTARAEVEGAGVYQRWRAHAAEDWTVFLHPISARGFWAGRAPFRTDAAQTAGPIAGPIAALTRASVRPSRALRFWRRVPDISAMIGSDPNVMFKIGIGEVPLLHQVTFSIWPDAAAMAAFARGNTAHGRAITAVRAEDWFSEELYARFTLAETTGTWTGTCGGVSPMTLRKKEVA